MINCNSCNFRCSHLFDQCGCDCLCSRTQESMTRYTSIITIAEYKEQIYSSLALAEPCGLPKEFESHIDCWWNLYSQRMCGNDMLYLLVRRESLKFLMACNAWMVDRSSSQNTSESRTDGESKQKSESQAQQNNFSSTYADSLGQARYDDLATSILRAESQATSHSETHDTAQRDMDDKGIGDGNSNTNADRRSRTIRDSRDVSESGTTMSRYGAKRGGTYSFSQSKTRGVGLPLGFASIDRTGTRSASDEFMRSDSSDTSFESRRGTSDRTLRSESVSWSNSARLSSSYFQNDILDQSWGISDAESHSRSRSQSDQTSEAEGLGQSATDARNRGTSASQATEQGRSEGFTKSEGQSHSQSTSNFDAGSQRFSHLLTLYNSTTKMIELLRLRLRLSQSYSIGRMIFGNRFGLCGADVFGSPIDARLRIPHGGVNGILCCPEDTKQNVIETKPVVKNGLLCLSN